MLEFLVDAVHFIKNPEAQATATALLNQVIARDQLEIRASQGRARIVSSTNAFVTDIKTGALSREDVKSRQRLVDAIKCLSEDQFTEQLVVPLLLRLGFQQVRPAGHRDKGLEYGRDLWAKFLLPTGHYLYFGAQVKIGVIDSAAHSDRNISTILNQLRMMKDHELFDPDINCNVLVDHVMLVSSGEITKAARALLEESLNRERIRHVLYIDRDTIVDLSIRVGLDVSSS